MHCILRCDSVAGQDIEHFDRCCEVICVLGKSLGWRATPWAHIVLRHATDFMRTWGGLGRYSCIVFEAAFRGYKPVYRNTVHTTTVRLYQPVGRSGLSQLIILYNVILELLRLGLRASQVRMHVHVPNGWTTSTIHQVGRLLREATAGGEVAFRHVGIRP